MKKFNKLTDDQLSKVLTAHDCGGLIRSGHADGDAYPACLVQCALEHKTALVYCDMKDPYEVANWFDVNYNSYWSTERFLKELEKVGLA